MTGAFLAILVTATATAGPCRALEWTGRVPAGDTLQWTVRTPAGAAVATVRAQDGGTQQRAGWLRDEDSRPGWVRAGLATVCGAGSPEAEPGPPQEAQELAVTAPSAATGLVAWGRSSSGEWDGLAAAPVAAGTGELTVTRNLEWTVSTLGTAEPWTAELRGGEAEVRLEPHRAVRRTWSDRFRDRFLWQLLPIHLLLFATALVVWTRASRRVGVVATTAAVGLGVGLLWPVLADPSGVLLWTGGAVADPRDSAALLAQLADALSRGGDVGFRFRYPEGSSVLWGGPALLGYLPGLPWAWIGSPVAGHNLSSAFWLAVLALSCGGLARARGMGPAGVVVATGAALASPALVDELDAWSLDRATLAVVPLAAWALQSCAQRPGPRSAALLAMAVGAGIYAQVYTGLYLALLLPLWTLPHLCPRPTERGRHRGPLKRLTWVAVAGLGAALLAAPGLHHLRDGTSVAAGSSDPRPLAAVSESTLQPFGAASDAAAIQADAALRRSRAARRTREGLPMATAQERLATAQSLSLDGRALLQPARWVPLGRWWWGLAALALLVARRRRTAVSTVLEPASLLVLAAGPFLVWDGGWTGIPLPHLAAWVAVPGWEQLKNVHRAALMAAPLAGLVPALLIDRLLPGRRTAWAGVLAGAVVLGLSHDGLPRWPKTRLLPRWPALEAARGMPVVAIPADTPTPPQVVEATLVHGLLLVGEPPFETRRQGVHPWLEDNALLNRWALQGGSTRPRRMLVADDPAAALADLQRYGVRGVAVFPGALPAGAGAGLPEELDELFGPGTTSSGATIWWLPQPSEVP